MARDRLPPREFKKLVRRLGGKPYLPQKINHALRQADASQFFWHSATKRQTQRAVQTLQQQHLVAPKFMPSRATPKRITEAAWRGGDLAAAHAVLLGSGRLPGKIRTEKFLEYYDQITRRPQDAKTALRELNLRGVEFLTKRQQVLLLGRLRDQGKLTLQNIGAQIQRAERRRQAFVKEGISDEQRQSAGRYLPTPEHLPAGIVRSINRPSADESKTSVAQNFTRATSVNRLADNPGEGATAKAHATTASALARGQPPQDPKTSMSRRGKSPAPAAPPELMDLPMDEE